MANDAKYHQNTGGCNQNGLGQAYRAKMTAYLLPEERTPQHVACQLLGGTLLLQPGMNGGDWTSVIHGGTLLLLMQCEVSIQGATRGHLVILDKHTSNRRVGVCLAQCSLGKLQSLAHIPPVILCYYVMQDQQSCGRDDGLQNSSTVQRSMSDKPGRRCVMIPGLLAEHKMQLRFLRQ